MAHLLQFPMNEGNQCLHSRWEQIDCSLSGWTFIRFSKCTTTKGFSPFYANILYYHILYFHILHYHTIYYAIMYSHKLYCHTIPSYTILSYYTLYCHILSYHRLYYHVLLLSYNILYYHRELYIKVFSTTIIIVLIWMSISMVSCGLRVPLGCVTWTVQRSGWLPNAYNATVYNCTKIY